jgi:hypothetical protein
MVNKDEELKSLKKKMKFKKLMVRKLTTYEE